MQTKIRSAEFQLTVRFVLYSFTPPSVLVHDWSSTSNQVVFVDVDNFLSLVDM